MPNDFDYVIDRLGVTEEDVAETARKYNISDPGEALSVTVLMKSRNPPLPAQPKAEMKYNPAGQIAESLTGGIGGAMSGATVGGPMGAAIGGVAGAALPLVINKLTDSPGEATSANRILDLAAPGMGKGVSMISKLGPTGKALTNTAANTLMAYLADSEDNKRSGTEGKNPLMRAAMTASLGGVTTGLTRQAARQKANVDLLDTLDQSYSQTTKPKELQDRIYNTLEYEKKPPVTLFGADEKPITMRDKTPSYSQTLTNSPDVQKFIRERPGDIYEYVLTPLNAAKNQAELQKAAPQFLTRLNTIQKLAGGKEKETLMTGLKNSFIDSIAMSNDNSRISNPDSFRMRLSAMGPEVVDSMMGKDAYPKLLMLSEAASKAGPLGRFSIRFGAGGNAFVAKHIVTLDEDDKITNNALDKGKMLALMTAPVFGKESFAAAAGIQAYEVYKIPIDKLLNKTDKKTLAALSSGLMNSTSNSVVNKLTEWFEKNADKKERVPLEGPPQLF